MGGYIQVFFQSRIGIICIGSYNPNKPDEIIASGYIDINKDNPNIPIDITKSNNGIRTIEKYKLYRNDQHNWYGEYTYISQPSPNSIVKTNSSQLIADIKIQTKPYKKSLFQ